ncbi:hypothetical protein INR49_019778 [Caranx melampygus]|nr:hypothetical protein INR49_019778 [Caranx melampygus]
MAGSSNEDLTLCPQTSCGSWNCNHNKPQTLWSEFSLVCRLLRMEWTPEGKQPPEPHANTSSFTREFDRHEPRMTQIVQELLKISTGKEVRTMNTKQKIFQTLEELRDEEFDKFRWYLCIATSIPRSHLDNANRCETVDRIVENYNQQSVEMVKNILKKINKNDLVEKL